MSLLTAAATLTLENQTQATLLPYVSARADYVRNLARIAGTDIQESIGNAEGALRKSAKAVGGVAIVGTFVSELTAGNETVATGVALTAVNAASDFMQPAGNVYERAGRAVVGTVGAGVIAGAASYVQQRVYGRVSREGLRRLPKTVDFLANTTGGQAKLTDNEIMDSNPPHIDVPELAQDKNDQSSFRSRVGTLFNRVRFPEGWTTKDSLTAQTVGSSLNLIHAHVKAGGSLSDEQSTKVEHGSALAISRVWAGLAAGVVLLQGAVGTASPEMMEAAVEKMNSPTALASLFLAAYLPVEWVRMSKGLVSKKSQPSVSGGAIPTQALS